MIQGITGAPTLDREVSFGKVSYPIRYGIFARYTVGILKLDLNAFVQSLTRTNVAPISDFIKLFSAMVAHNFQAAHQPIPTPEHWAAMVDMEPDPEAKLKEICDKVGEVFAAFLQASAKTKPQEPAPAQLN